MTVALALHSTLNHPEKSKTYTRMLFLDYSSAFNTIRPMRLTVPQPLTMAYRGLVESILTSGITVWYGNTTQAERKSLQRVVKTAERIIGSGLPAMDTIYTQHCRRRVQNILKDSHHPAHPLFVWRDSGDNLRHHRPESFSTHKTRFFNKFSLFLPLVAEDINDGSQYER